jgi:perosamine synthetase
MCDIWELEDLCSANGIFLIEDAAEAIGASANGTPAGSFGWISCFSFFANKVITCGEGGMLLTNSKDLDTSARTYRDHGDDATDIARHYYEAAVPGFNYRMTNLQAGVALAQLKRLDYFLEERRRIDLDYRLNFFDEDLIRLQHIPRWCIPNGWMASFLVPDRDDTIIYLRQQGIESRPFFKPVHTMPYIQEPEQYPQAERYSAHGINLPTYVDLRTEDIKFICDKVLEITKSEGELVL